MTKFDRLLAKRIANEFSTNKKDELGLTEAFIEICNFLGDNPDYLSWRSRKSKPDVHTESGLSQLADKFFKGYRRSDLPKEPTTVPDEAVSAVMRSAYGYSLKQSERIKKEHQHSMSAENCVGALLERYLDSVLRTEGWHWCCGDFVKAVDFINRNEDGKWLTLQIKNRDNSENSSSSAIRNGTPIQKWFRSFSKKPKTNWDNLPPAMRNKGLSEEGFLTFIENYISFANSRL